MLPAPYALGLKPDAHIHSNNSTTALTVSNESGGYGLYATTAGNIAVLAKSSSSPFYIIPGPSGMIGVYGVGDGKGVHGAGGHTGVYGEGTIDGVKGESIDGNAVHWLSANDNGVIGESTDGNGVRGVSTNDYGVVGVTNSSDANYAGVLILKRSTCL